MNQIDLKAKIHLRFNDLLSFCSVYLIGSATSGFDPLKSDIDIIVVINNDCPQDVLEWRQAQVIDAWKKLKSLDFEEFLTPPNQVRGDCETIMEDEFLDYLWTFAARAWIPFKDNWQLVGGKDFVPNQLPEPSLLYADLKVSFEFFVDFFLKKELSTYGKSKYLKRGLTKAIWMDTGKKPQRERVWELCWERYPHNLISHIQSECAEERKACYTVYGLLYLVYVKNIVFCKDESVYSGSPSIEYQLEVSQKIFSLNRKTRAQYIELMSDNSPKERYAKYKNELVFGTTIEMVLLLEKYMDFFAIKAEEIEQIIDSIFQMLLDYETCSDVEGQLEKFRSTIFPTFTKHLRMFIKKSRNKDSQL